MSLSLYAPPGFCSSMRWLGDVQRGRAFRKYFVFVNRVLASNDQVQSVTYVQQPSHGSSSRPCADYSLHASQNMPTGHVLKKNCRRRLTGKLILFDFFFVLYAIGWASKCDINPRLADGIQSSMSLSLYAPPGFCSSMRWLGDVQRGRAFRKYFVFVNRVLASNDQVQSVTYVQQPSHGSSSRPCADYSLHASQNMPTGHVLKKNCRRRLTGKLILFDFFFVLYAIGWASKCAVNPRLADGIRSYHSVNDSPRHPMVPT